MNNVRTRLHKLLLCPRELWIVYVLKVLESLSYFSASLNLTPYLTECFGYTDLQAGAVYSAWGVIAGIIAFVCSPAIDKLGVRPSLVWGGVFLTCGRILFAAATTPSQLYASLFVLQPIGMALAIPVLSIAIRRITNDETVTTAFGVFYSLMNLGALVSGLGTDVIRGWLGYGSASLRTTYWLGAAVSVVYTAVAYVAFRPLPAPDAESAVPSTWRSFCTAEARETIRDAAFWPLVAFSGIIFGAKSVFRHVDTTLPKWMEREIGAKAAYGTIYSINPAIIIVAVPVAQVCARAHTAWR